MKKKNANRFLREVEVFVSDPTDNTNIVERLWKLVKLSRAVGFLYLPDELGEDQEGNSFLDIGVADLIRGQIVEMMSNLAARDRAEILPPAHMIKIAFRTADRALDMEFVGGSDPLHQILPFTILMVMVSQGVRGVTRCGDKSCGRYIFQMSRRRAYCDEACKQRAYNQRKKSKKTGADQSAQNQEED